jgi:hypothetical protein
VVTGGLVEKLDAAHALSRMGEQVTGALAVGVQLGYGLV